MLTTNAEQGIYNPNHGASHDHNHYQNLILLLFDGFHSCLSTAKEKEPVSCDLFAINIYR